MGYLTIRFSSWMMDQYVESLHVERETELGHSIPRSESNYLP
jgi:hypothetical protein